MKLGNRTMSRMLCTEALEGRWLLSVAVPFAGAPLSGDSGSVHVVASDVQEGEEGEEIQVEPSELPAAVIAALHAKFGGDVQILEAQFEEEDGSEYGITAKSGGNDYDITLSPSGSILEVEQLLTVEELPTVSMAVTANVMVPLDDVLMRLPFATVPVHDVIPAPPSLQA